MNSSPWPGATTVRAAQIRKTSIDLCLAWLLIAVLTAAAQLAQAQRDLSLGEQFAQLDRAASWQLLREVELDFDTFHPQGLSRAGDQLFLSAVEILERTRRLPADSAGPDRTVGRGVGHLFKFSADGSLLDSVQLGSEARYHPGGIDFDGQWLWVSVAEYRPDSSSLVYRVNPDTLAAELVFEFPDHLGAIVHDRSSGTLVAASWGSRRFYKWTPTAAGSVDYSKPTIINNPNHFIDLQDCQSLPPQHMLCGGIATLRSNQGAATTIGGLELIDFNAMTATHQLPVAMTSASGALLTRNPVLISSDREGLLLMAAPDDNPTRLYTYRLMPANQD